MMEITTVIALTGFPRKCRTHLRYFRPLNPNSTGSSVRIIEVSDNRGWDDRGSTIVAYNVTYALPNV